MTYDPLNRFYELVGTNPRRRVYDGDELIMEYHPNGAMSRRFVHGPGTDEPLVWYGGGGSVRRFLHADERGSIVSATDSAGTPVVTYRYDEYGLGASGNSGTFFYTGQTGYTELGLYYYKNRWRHPKLDRFMQTDPIGYGAGMNMYAYVKGDPVNFTDPLGLKKENENEDSDHDDIIVLARRGSGSAGGSGVGGRGGTPSVDISPVPNDDVDGDGKPDPNIVVTGQEPLLILAGIYNGQRTFGANPTFSNKANMHFPAGRITSGGQGGYAGALGDLDRLARLNNLTSPSGVNIFKLPPQGWLPSFNPHSGYQILTHVGTGLTFRAHGARNVVVIDIPPGLLIGNGAFDVGAYWESVIIGEGSDWREDPYEANGNGGRKAPEAATQHRP